MSFATNLSDAFRLATWRAPLDHSAVMSPVTAFRLFAAGVIVLGTCEYFLTDASTRVFNPNGINSLIAAAAVQAFIIVLFARADQRSWTIRNLILLHLVSIVIAIVELAVIRAFDFDNPALTSPGVALGMILVVPAVLIWAIGAARQAFKVSPGLRRPLVRACTVTLLSFAAPLALPDWPIAFSRNFDRSTANLWEIARHHLRPQSYSESEIEEQVAKFRKAEIAAVHLEARQNALLSAAVDTFAPRDPNGTNVFTIGIAGWGDQDVFMLETQQSMDILNARFHSRGHALSLVNNI